MKKIGFLMTVLFAAMIFFVSCAHQGDTVQKQQVSTQLRADLLPSVDVSTLDVASVQLASYDGAKAILVQDTPAEDPKKLDFATILNILLSVMGVVFAGFVAKFKMKLSQLITLARLVVEAGTEIDDMLEDDNVSKAEIAKFRAKTVDIRDAFKELISFKKE